MTYQTKCYNAYNMGNCKEVKLKKFTLEQDDRGYYLAATYRVEDDHAIREIEIPKIRLNLDEKRFRIDIENDPCACYKVGRVDLGFGELPLDWEKNKDGLTYLFTDRVLHEKYTEMTLDEIEKKLGYKVKIVSKKKE